MPAPTDREAWHNSHLKLEWKRFQGQSHVDFIKMQADILHRYVKVPVGTDMMP
ncbi:MAG: beta-galactosidase, partial [Clostridia bacterium]|nr:beta-galactosidase [Clostridia bacterium]